MPNHAQPNRRICLAPMMDLSDKHCRFLWRLISHHALLYTEMVTTGALLYGDTRKFLDYNDCEHPIALQLGGSNPHELAQCSILAEKWGYDEVNLNCGCPSDKVQQGKIGACLMREPAIVADCFKAMSDASTLPVTIKHRIGIDNMDDYEGMANFVQTLSKAGCKTFIVHARKAWLSGLSPKDNRNVPPLRYELVHRLKREFPELEIIINGGITSLEAAEAHLKFVDGVMIGREAYSNPYCLAPVDGQFYGDNRNAPSREQVFSKFIDYCDLQVKKGTRLNHITRHLLGLFHNVPGARRFRRHISENAHKPETSVDMIRNALEYLHC